MDNLFDGSRDADVPQNNGWLEEGTYSVELKRIRVFQSRRKEWLTAIEFKVLTSTNPAILPGMYRSQVLKCFWDNFKGHVKAFCQAIFEAKGADPRTLTDQHVKEIFGTGDYQSNGGTKCAGTVLNVVCEKIDKKNSPGKYTKYMWSAPLTSGADTPALITPPSAICTGRTRVKTDATPEEAAA